LFTNAGFYKKFVTHIIFFNVCVISKDSNLPNGGEYKQAWKIVSKEGYASFINELRNIKSKNK